jgi:ATP-dependent Clp protease ATP-binding subunit ClpC
MTKSQRPEETIRRWMERDLTEDAARGRLPPAFEVDDIRETVAELLTAGRVPVLTGESGVGKTAVVYELVRRAHAGEGPHPLRGKRVLQFSFQHRASALKEPEKQLRPEVQQLIEALLESADEVVPFFRDFHFGYMFDLEPQMEMLATRFPGAILAEGIRATVQAMFENTPGLEQRYMILQVDEPVPDRMRRILDRWGEDQSVRRGMRFEQAALEQSLHLTHRFLARNRLPRSALDLLAQVSTLVGDRRVVTAADVNDRFCTVHRTPRALVDPSLPLDLGALETKFASQVLGQPEAVKSVVNMIGLIKAGLSDMRRPFGAFMFVGPTGVGKTHVAQLLAEYLFGSRDRMIRFNLADCPNENSGDMLFGNPTAYTLYERRGLLSQRILGHPFAVLLLDEFEKAHGKVHDRFLQLIDEGSYQNGAGERVSCRSMIIIATSNAGAELYRGRTLGFGPTLRGPEDTQELQRRLEAHFRFELLNRFDQIVHFHALSRDDIRQIALRELEQIRNRAGIKQRGVELEVDEVVLDWLAVHGYEPDYGARFLRRTIERHVTTALAETIVRERPSPGAKIALTVRHNRIVARLIPVEPVVRPQREVVTMPLGTTRQVRSLDSENLREEAARILAAAQERLESLEHREAEYSSLIEKMNESSFWENAAERSRVLERFRDMDVSIQVERRLARPILELADWLKRSTESMDARGRLARALEAAAQALADWHDRAAEEGAGAVWLLIQSVDPLRPAGRWIEDLAHMEIAWCRKLMLSVSVAAYGLLDEELTRVVLDVEGPGASAYLAMESGIHRLCRRKEGDLRAEIASLPKGQSPSQQSPDLTLVRRRAGLFGLDVEYRGRVAFDERGMAVELLGGRAETLSHLLSDLRRAWAEVAPEPPEVSRIYGQTGGLVRDPRTGASMPRLRDVLRGRLDKFLEAWRHRATGPAAQANATSEGRSDRGR